MQMDREGLFEYTVRLRYHWDFFLCRNILFEIGGRGKYRVEMSVCILDPDSRKTGFTWFFLALKIIFPVLHDLSEKNILFKINLISIY